MYSLVWWWHLPFVSFDGYGTILESVLGMKHKHRKYVHGTYYHTHAYNKTTTHTGVLQYVSFEKCILK